MGFFAGRIGFERFRIAGKTRRKFGPEHLETLERFSIDQVGTASTDEPQVGFVAGNHLLDLSFRLEKNIFDDVLHCGVRIDTHTIPAALRKAWLQMELEAMGADNPSGRPNTAQRQEAKEAVEARCVEEAKDGKFRRMQHLAALWDARQGILYLGGSGAAAIEQSAGLFASAFDLSLERVTSGRLAEQWAAAAKKQAALDDLAPAAFLEEQPAADIAWLSGAAANFDFLGNEFLLWLWWSFNQEAGEIGLPDGTAAAGMLNRTLSLECPRAESGKETITAESPVRLPEARHGIASGKLPRKSGLLLARDGIQHEFVLQAETLAVSGAKTQLSESGDAAGGGAEDRIEALRHLSETIDLLFGAFCKRRLASAWQSDLEQIRRWLRKKPSDSKKTAA